MWKNVKKLECSRFVVVYLKSKIILERDWDMDKTMFALAVSLASPNEAAISKVNEAFSTIEENGNVIFEYDPSQDETYDELSEIDGYLTLGILCKADGKFYASPDLTQKLAEEGETEPTEIDYTFLSDIADFEEEAQSEIDSEIEKIIAQNYNKTVSEPTVVETVQEEPIEEPKTDYQEPVQKHEQTIEESKKEIEPVGQHFANSAPKGKIDPLLTLSADIFENKIQATLPVYDEYVREQLRPQIAEAESRVHMARDQAIFSIYDILKEHKVEIKSDFDEMFAKDIKEHELELEQIDRKLEQDTQNKIHENDEKYQKSQDDYVASQEANLRMQFDAEHKKAYLDDLSAEINQLKKQATELRDTANSQYEKLYNKESLRYVTREMRKLDFSAIVEEFSNIVNEETEKLNHEAVAFKEEFGSVTERLVKERDEYKRENENLKSEVERLKNEWESTVTGEADRKAQIMSTEKDDLLSKAHAATAQNQRTIDLLNSNLESLRNENNLLRERSYNGFAQPMAQPPIQPQTSQQQATQQTVQLPTQKTAQKSVGENLKNLANDKQSVGKMIVMGIAVALAICGLLIGFSMMTRHNSSAPVESYSQKASSAVTKDVPSSSAESTENEASSEDAVSNDDSSDSENAKQYSSGSKWTYTKDGKNYEVTMDSPTTGTYTDENGNVHKITLEN